MFHCPSTSRGSRWRPITTLKTLKRNQNEQFGCGNWFQDGFYIHFNSIHFEARKNLLKMQWVVDAWIWRVKWQTNRVSKVVFTVILFLIYFRFVLRKGFAPDLVRLYCHVHKRKMPKIVNQIKWFFFYCSKVFLVHSLCHCNSAVSRGFGKSIFNRNSSTFYWMMQAHHWSMKCFTRKFKMIDIKMTALTTK